MLGPTANGRLMGPGTIGSSGSAHHRNLWPSAAAAAIAASSTSGSSRSFEFQTSNGEVTESLFAAGGYNTPPASSPFLSCSPLELVAKNFHSTGAAVTFSQANSSIFVQSQTDFINGTTSVAKKTETCIGRWEHGTLEPLQIQVPTVPSVTNLTIKTENISSGSQITYNSNNLNNHNNTSNKSDGLDQRRLYYQQLQHQHHVQQEQQQQQLPVQNNHHHHRQQSLITSNSARTTLLRLSEHHRQRDHSSTPGSINGNGSSTLDLVVTPTTATKTVTTATVAPSCLSSPSFALCPINQQQQQQQRTVLHQQQQQRPSDCSVIVTARSNRQQYPQRAPHSAGATWSSSTVVQPTRSSPLDAACSAIHIKREPCQVSEVTTSNNFEASSSSTTTALTAVVKLEAPSPKAVPANIGTAMDHIGITSTQNNAAATIPVGIAVARQRLQDSTGGVGGPLSSQLHQAKELNRFGIAATGSTADLGCTTPSLSQNMFFTGTNSTMIPLSSEAVTMGVTNAAAAAAAAAVQNAVRTPPALWQYPGCQQPAQGPQPVLPQLALVGSAPGTGLPDKKVVGYLVLDRIVPTPPEDDPSMKKAPVPMESMLPMPPMPPVGFQLVRDPTTGQILFLPTTTTIEPFPQTVVWPSYPQSTAAIQPPHLLLPQIPQQQLQPPPLAPLQMLSSDYLATASSTTLHQQQHTQTHHSTRYVALTSDGNKRTSSNKSTASNMSMPCQPTIPMPIPSHTFIKIEDCSGSAASSCNNSTQIFHEQEKTIQTSTIGTSPDIAPQLLFQQGNLIQITPSTKTTATLLEPPAIMPAIETAVPNPITPPPIHSICFDSSESPSARTPSSHMSNSSA
ncbi:flocculation protein FLO11-like isoform X2 [Aedes aegypti]|uniref:Uncharacterized protein n=1 Tax=Aedes aegypti TaxID=7159 RepID=A0A6I8TVD1_AEDAE|nr:flocculation protein FLO11-like isoform X2 [Aedes aegypti]